MSAKLKTSLKLGVSPSFSVNLLVLRLEMLLRPLVSTVLAPVRVPKIIDLDGHRHVRFKHHGSESGSVLHHVRFHQLTVDELLVDQSYLEPPSA